MADPIILKRPKHRKRTWYKIPESVLDQIPDVLRRTGSQQETARILKISTSKVSRWLREHGYQRRSVIIPPTDRP